MNPKKDDSQKAKDPVNDNSHNDDLFKEIEGLTNLEKELQAAEQKLQESEQKAQEMNNAYKRALADLENFRRRTEQERGDFVKFASQKLLLEILPCLDNFKKALAYVPKESQSENWVQGLVHSVNHFEQTLQKQGVEEIKAIGHKLDHNLHEAVLQGPGAKDVVLEELEKGYLYHGRVVKHTKVKVGNGEKE